jgi:hypothetical protein
MTLHEGASTTKKGTMGFFDQFKPGSRSPRCPITPDDRQWIENSFAWFDEEFGGNALRNGPMIIPDGVSFPHPYTPDTDGVEELFERVCGWMDVDRGSLLLDIYDPEEGPQHVAETWRADDSAGHLLWDESTRRWVIGLDSRMLPDPMAVVAVLAHETAHVHLFGFGRVHPEEEDHEPLTDLLAIYYGFGVFLGNSAFRSEQKNSVTSSTFKARRMGYLPEPMIGYALALTAIAKNDTDPAWKELLEFGIRSPFDASLKFLLDEREKLIDSLLE